MSFSCKIRVLLMSCKFTRNYQRLLGAKRAPPTWQVRCRLLGQRVHKSAQEHIQPWGPSWRAKMFPKAWLPEPRFTYNLPAIRKPPTTLSAQVGN